MSIRQAVAMFSAFVMLLLVPASSAAAKPTYDLVVYGGTAAGVITAYSGAREGLRVVLLEPGAHLGGMVSGGLSATDVGNFGVIGGYARDFFEQAASHYGANTLDKEADWRSEPHVAEEVFHRMLIQARVEVRFHERVKERGGVQVSTRRVKSITTEDGVVWSGRVFADCSYEGEVMAQAHVGYVWGRESTNEFGESLAGVREHTPAHQFTWPLSAYEPLSADDNGRRLLPLVYAAPLGKPGYGDEKVQAYNFRVILTRDPANSLPYTKPAGYDRAQFALLQRYITEFKAHKGRKPVLNDLMMPISIPHEKADFNNSGPVSTDFIGQSWNYPDGSYAMKAELVRKHLEYTQGFFYFLSQDESVPRSLQAEVNAWGLPKDEFVDTDHWPNQLYVREARRMRGDYVMRQADLQSNRTKPDSIGMGSYNSDSHNVQRVIMPDGTLQNEGDVQVPVQPYEIAYRILTPKQSEVENLLVPVCFSATHVAYSSIRMEPQYMIMGQAAGVAASLAIRHHTSVQRIPIGELQKKLRQRHGVLHIQQAILTSRRNRNLRRAPLLPPRQPNPDNRFRLRCRADGPRYTLILSPKPQAKS